MLAIFKILKVYRDIKIYREYVKTIKNESVNSAFWMRKKLRKDYLSRIFTIINLPPSVIYSPDLPKDSRPSFVLSEIQPINEYLKQLNLEEILTLWIDPVKGTNEESYLVVYQYVFRELSLIWIARFISEILLGCYIFYKFDWIISLF